MFDEFGEGGGRRVVDASKQKARGVWGGRGAKAGERYTGVWLVGRSVGLVEPPFCLGSDGTRYVAPVIGFRSWCVSRFPSISLGLPRPAQEERFVCVGSGRVFLLLVG